MDFGALPPEINSARMYAGAGAGPMLAAATAWDHIAGELHGSAVSYHSTVIGLTTGPWQGPASVAMAAAAAPYVAWLSSTAAQCEQVANQARAAVSAYESAFAMTVPPPVIATNRAQLMLLVATNLLGQNTPAIMATEAHYGEMWAQDAAAMYCYAANSAAASTLAPFVSPQQTTNPSGLAAQAAALTQATGTGAVSHAQNTWSLSAVPQALQSMASPTSSTAGFSQTAVGTSTSAASSAASGPAAALTALTGTSGRGALGVGNGSAATSGLGGLSGLLGTATSASNTAADLGSDAAGVGADGIGLGTDFGGLGTDFLGVGFDFLGADELTEFGGLGPLGSVGLPGPFGGLGGFGPLGDIGGVGASASVGQAASLGALSVPQSWTDVAAVAPIAPAGAAAVPDGGISAVPAVSAVGSGMPKVSVTGLAGREADAIQRLGFTVHGDPEFTDGRVSLDH